MSDIGLVMILFVGVLLLVGILRFLAWLTELQNEHGSLGRAGVNTFKKYVEVRPRVMSRSANDAPASALLSPQTDSPQTDRQPATAQPGRAELLTLFKALRAAGIKRDDIRPALKGVGLPLDNNLWTDAAPAESDEAESSYRTPIVGRHTNARFETDPDYPYQAPA